MNLKVCVQPTFSFLYSLGVQSREWCGFPHHNWPNQDNTSQAGQGVHVPDDYISHQVDTKITHQEW